MSDSSDPRNGWFQDSGPDERRGWFLRRRSTIFFSVFLIAAGVLLFLGNLGVLPVQELWRYWPLLLIAGGLGRLTTSASAGTRAWGIFMLLFGVLFLLMNLGILHVRPTGFWPFSLLLIAVGFAALVRVLDSSRRLPDGAPHAFMLRDPIDYEKTVSDVVVFGELKRKLETNDFQGGELTTVFGNIEMDLRYALITAITRRAILNVTAVFGAAKIRVPQNWRVHVTGAGILGNFNDKTIPPNTGPDAPTLVITGSSIFSQVEIED